MTLCQDGRDKDAQPNVQKQRKFVLVKLFGLIGYPLEHSSQKRTSRRNFRKPVWETTVIKIFHCQI